MLLYNEIETNYKNYNGYCNYVKNKTNKIGNIQFIVELNKYNFIDSELLATFLEYLYNIDEDAELKSEYLYAYFNTFNKNSKLNKNLYNDYVVKFKKFGKDRSLKPRIRFKYLDLVELFN